MTSRLPSVSIITPVYNGSAFLEELILSVRDQEYPAVEHIVIDDGSTDGGATTAILARYPHLRWWSRPNRGQYASMNEGLLAAQGDWVCFISADDLLTPGALQAAMQAVLQADLQADLQKNCDVAYGKTLFIRADGTRYEVQNFIHRVPPAMFAYLNVISHCSLYARRERLIAHNLTFDETLRLTADYDWIVRLVKAGLRFTYVNRYLSSVRRHAEQASVRSLGEQKHELASVQRRHGVNQGLFRFVTTIYYLRSVAIEIPYLLRTGGIKALLRRADRWYRRTLKKPDRPVEH